jgi:hypothetical protein
MAEPLKVKLEVTANKSQNQLPSDQLLDSLIEKAFEPVTSASGAELASRLAIPNVPISFTIVIKPGAPGSTTAVPVHVTVSNAPKMVESLRGLEEEVENVLFHNLRKGSPPKDLLEALGYDTAASPKFRLSFPQSKPEGIAPRDLEIAAGCEPGTSYSWGKGCNNWPW